MAIPIGSVTTGPRRTGKVHARRLPSRDAITYDRYAARYVTRRNYIFLVCKNKHLESIRMYRVVNLRHAVALMPSPYRKRTLTFSDINRPGTPLCLHPMKMADAQDDNEMIDGDTEHIGGIRSSSATAHPASESTH